MQSAKTPQIGHCERIVVTTADGRVFDLGKPDAMLFKLRVFFYRIWRYING